jgi:hypothetical protein
LEKVPSVISITGFDGSFGKRVALKVPDTKPSLELVILTVYLLVTVGIYSAEGKKRQYKFVAGIVAG